jgi:hypothetical protein
VAILPPIVLPNQGSNTMDKNKILKIAGIAAVSGGSVALYFAGSTEVMITGLVGGVFIVIGLIASFFK